MSKQKIMLKNKKKAHDPIFTTVSVIVVCLLLFVGFKFGCQYLKYLELCSELNICNVQLAQNEKRYNDLCEQRELLKTDIYVEYIARKNLGMVMSGEKLVYPTVESDAPILDVNLNAVDFLH